MSLSLQLSDEESLRIKSYAKLKGISISELIREFVLNRIEDEIDLKECREAILEHRKNPITYSHEEMKKMVGLS